MALERPVARNQGSPSGQKESVLLGRLNLAYGDSMNKGDEKNASGNTLGSDTCNDSVRNPGAKHSLFEQRANGAFASLLASGCWRIRAYRCRGSSPGENRT